MTLASALAAVPPESGSVASELIPVALTQLSDLTSGCPTGPRSGTENQDARSEPFVMVWSPREPVPKEC
jgi:hypothetical protein